MEPRAAAAYLERHYSAVTPQLCKTRRAQDRPRKAIIAMYAELRQLPEPEQAALIAAIADLCTEANMRPGQALEVLYNVKRVQLTQGAPQ